MAVKMPTDISWTWWKKNAPASLPEDAVIKEKLKHIEATPIKTSIKALQEAAPTGLEFGQAVAAHVEPYHALIEQLKRYRSVVTKQKDTHTDFLTAIDKLIDIAKKDHADLGRIAELVKSQGLQATKTKKQAIKRIALLFEAVDGMRIKAGRIDAQVRAANDSDTLERLIGNVRYIQQLAKKNLLTAQTVVKDTPDADQEFTNAMEGFKITVKNVMETTRELEKTMVAKAIQMLGDKEGKALFLAAQPVAPR